MYSYTSVAELDVQSTVRIRSRFVHPAVHSRLVPEGQIRLAESIADSSFDLATVLEQSMPARWIWERTDSVMWMPAFDRLTEVLRQGSGDLLVLVLESLEVLLVNCLADSAFFGWSDLLALIEREEGIADEVRYLALRVLRRHPLLNNPRKLTQPVLGSGSVNPLSISLFVVDVNPNSKTWLIGRDLGVVDVERVTRAVEPLTATVGVVWYYTAMEIMTSLKPRFLGKYISEKDLGILKSCAEYLYWDSLVEEENDTLQSVLEFATVVVRESTYAEHMSQLLGLSVGGASGDRSAGIPGTIKKLLTGDSPPFPEKIVYALLGLVGSKCVAPLGGWAPPSVGVSAFTPWLSSAVSFIETRHQDLATSIVLTRLVGTVIDVGSQALAGMFRDCGGFRVAASRLSVEIAELINSSSSSSYTEYHSRCVLVRGLFRMCELAFQALETHGAVPAHNLHQVIGLVENFFPILKIIFENPKSVSVGTVAISASVLGHLIGHEPTSIVQLVGHGLVESLVAALRCEEVLQSTEAISSITACFAAICVHSDGEKKLGEIGDPINTIIIPAFANPAVAIHWIGNHHVLDTADFSVGSLVGSSCDEVIRNRPSWRQPVVNAVLGSLDRMATVEDTIAYKEFMADMYQSICKFIEKICANLDTSGSFLNANGLGKLLAIISNNKSLFPINFTHVSPSHSLCKLYKQFAQQSAVLHRWLDANLDVARRVVANLPAADDPATFVDNMSEFHLAIHTVAVALKDVTPTCNPKVFEPFIGILDLLCEPSGSCGKSLFHRIASLACKFSITDSTAKAAEEKELRRRLRDERPCIEALFQVYGPSGVPSDGEGVRGLWMVVRGFLCQVARVINHPNVPLRRGRNGPVPVARSISPSALQAGSRLAVIACEMLSDEFWLNEAVDLLCRLHIEDKHHMTRTVCLDSFYKAGGVAGLARALDFAARTGAGEALQGILWWFERTTSLKRMQNARITALLEKCAEARFSPVSLVSSLQGEFGRAFAPHWRNDECLRKTISAKASASLLKAFTHVLEPHKDVVRVSSSRSSNEYMAYSEVEEMACDIATDFMERTLVLGSSDQTASVAAQTHIADVCVRLSHNRILKLGDVDDDEVVKQIQEHMASDYLEAEGDDYYGRLRDRAGTTVVVEEDIESGANMDDEELGTQSRIDNAAMSTVRGSIDLVSVETDGPVVADTLAVTADYSVYNARYITEKCYKELRDYSL